jgi:hypothetical protein
MAFELEALAERLERATGPDRALDAELHSAWGRSISAGWEHLTPLYTASLDAALSLAAGHAILITLSEIKGDGMPRCVFGKPEDGTLYEAIAATMPLAVCAAAARARVAR